jgi:cytochrome c-type biogenesis protein
MSIEQVSLPLAFAAGLASFLSPCVLPLVPAYVAYLARQMGRQPGPAAGEGPGAMPAAALNVPSPRSPIFLSGAAFVAGLSLVFITAFYALSSLLTPYRLAVATVAGAVVVVLGLSTAGLFQLPFLDREFRIMRKAPARDGPIGGFLLGVGFAAGWTPCIGITLGAVMSAGLAQGTTLRGLVLMLAYCLGLGLPFLLLSLALKRSVALVRGLSRHRRVIDRASGAVLVVMGILLLTNNLVTLTSFLNRILPGQVVYPFGL